MISTSLSFKNLERYKNQILATLAGSLWLCHCSPEVTILKFPSSEYYSIFTRTCSCMACTYPSSPPVRKFAASIGACHCGGSIMDRICCQCRWYYWNDIIRDAAKCDWPEEVALPTYNSTHCKSVSLYLKFGRTLTTW